MNYSSDTNLLNGQEAENWGQSMLQAGVQIAVQR
jgi:hypothetical protein